MEPLRNVILNVLNLAGPSGVGRTVLMKVVYFAQLESWQQRGEPLTDVAFYSYKFGAWAPEVTHVADAVPAIEHSWLQLIYPEHRYKLREDAPPPPNLSPKAEAILRSVFERYGTMTALHVGNLSKQTEPMQHAEPGVPLDFSIVAPARSRLTIRNSALAHAQAEHDWSVRGTPEELAERDEVEHEAWSEARRRANAT
jgi:uncharacterized phage-associated protein